MTGVAIGWSESAGKREAVVGYVLELASAVPEPA